MKYQNIINVALKRGVLDHMKFPKDSINHSSMILANILAIMKVKNKHESIWV